MNELFLALFLITTILLLMSGFQVAFSLAGSSLLFALIGILLEDFSGFQDLTLAYPGRVFGVMSKDTLIAIPLFVFMGVVLEKSRLAEDLLETMGLLFGKVRGGLGVSIFIVGTLLAASTGIVGATVVTMGLISLPTMLRSKYNPELASGIVAASGTLGQIIPPSIILIILGDQISTAYQQALRSMGDFSGASVSVGELFFGALIPGLLLVCAYILYIVLIALFKPEWAPAATESMPAKSVAEVSTGDSKQSKVENRDLLKSEAKLYRKVLTVLLPPLLLIIGVLGSILLGIATATEAASVGCVGAIGLALLKGKLSWKVFQEVLQNTTKINSMVFMILLAASLFALVFRGYDGDAIVANLLTDLPGGKWGAFVLIMLLMFVLGFFLDFFEITFVVVPIIGPILLMMDVNPVWLGVMIAINLQTSFLTPPFGFALFYLRGVAPESIHTMQIYRGVIPFIGIQILMLCLLAIFPELATWLPDMIYNS